MPKCRLPQPTRSLKRHLTFATKSPPFSFLTQHQIVDNERRFDQDIMAFRRVGEKLMAVQMGVRKGVLRGKNQFTFDLQPQIEQEFLKAYYTTNQIPREILLNKPCWQGNEEKKALEDFLSSQAECACFLDDSAASR